MLPSSAHGFVALVDGQVLSTNSVRRCSISRMITAKTLDSIA